MRDNLRCSIPVKKSYQNPPNPVIAMIYEMMVTPDSNYVISCSKDQSIKMWKISDRSNVFSINKAHSGKSS